MRPPRAGPTTASIGPATSARILSASPRQSVSVLSGCMKTRAFCRNTGLRSPDDRMKWPSSTAPASRKIASTSSVVIFGGSLLSAIDPLGLADAGIVLELRNQPVQVLEVPDFQIDQHLGEVGCGAYHRQRMDIGIVGGDHLGDVGERARRIDGRHRDPRRKALLGVLVDVPADV